MPKSYTVCTVPGCPTLVAGGGRCDDCKRQADQARGSAAQRGYAGKTWRTARAATLQRDPVCVICHTAESTVADHYPTSRRDLVAMKVPNPDHPSRLRGLCSSCHSRETTRAQPGGWNQRP